MLTSEQRKLLKDTIDELKRQRHNLPSRESYTGKGAELKGKAPVGYGKGKRKK